MVLVHGWGGRGRGARVRAGAARCRRGWCCSITWVTAGASGEATLIHFWNGSRRQVSDLSQLHPVAALVGHSLGAAAVGAWLNATRLNLRAVLVAPPTSVERYSGYFARRMGIPETVRRAMQERFEQRLGRRWSEFELPHAVEKVNAAALVIHDAGDTSVPQSSGIALARAWRDARFVGTQGLGHEVLRDPDVARCR